MKIKNIYSLAVFCLISSGLSAQVGINTSNPQVTLDVVGNGSSTTVKDGIMAPRISKQQLAAKVAGTYGNPQTGSLVYVTDVTPPSGTTPSLAQVAQISAIGYHQFDGTIWRVVSPQVLNIYNSDDALTGNRIATLAANNLTFAATTGTFSLQTNNNGFQRANFSNVSTGASSRMDVLVGAGSGGVYLGLDNGSAIFGAGSKGYLDNRSGGRLAFGTQGTESMTIATNGNVGISTSTPNTILDLGTSNGAGSATAVAGKKLAVFNNSAGTDFYGLGINTDYLQFHAGSSAAEAPGMVLGTSGNVGIGSTAPNRKLHVEGAGYFNAAVNTGVTKNALDINIGQDGFGYGNRTDNFGINIRSVSSIGSGSVARINFGDINATTAGSGKYLSFSVGNSLNELMYLTDNNSGRVGIGTTTPTEKLHVIGNILASGTVTPSDIRIKKDIVDNGYGLNEILKLRTINYKYKDERLSKDKKVGFVAQEIQASMPELVSTANDEMKTLGVNYSEMTVVLTKAMQEQQKIIRDQHEILKDQQKQINDLKSKVENLSK